MAPVSQPDHDIAESESRTSSHRSDAKLFSEQIKDIIQDLYQIMVQVNSFDLAGRPSKEVLEAGMYVLNDVYLSKT